MIGYDHHVLPTTLWGPRLEMQDVVDGKCTEIQLAFKRLESGRVFKPKNFVVQACKDFDCEYPTSGTPWPESGRMVRVMLYNATVKNPMDRVGAFLIVDHIPK